MTVLLDPGRHREPIEPMERRSGVRWAVVVLAFAVLVGAGCGDPEAVEPAEPVQPGGLPATTVFMPPDPAAAPVGSVTPEKVTEPCPESVSVETNADDAGDMDAMMAESARLEPMLGQVLAYGGQHADQFGTYGFIWHGAGDASVFISFTSDLDAHRDALAEFVEHPDELIVCQVAVSGDASAALQAQLTQELAGRFLSIGRGMGAVEVVLAPNEAALAAELAARYGNAIELTVGALPYPLDRASSICEPPPEERSLSGLDIAIVPPAGPLTAGGIEPLGFTLTLTNVGDSSIRFDSGAAIGTFLDTEGNVVSSSDNVSIADLGYTVDLAPGASTELPLYASAASCDPDLGYVLPPGDYLLIAHVPHIDGDITTLASAPLPVTIAL